MDQSQPVTVTAVRATGISPDGRNIVLSVTVKYSGAERRYSVPIDCLHDLVLDLRRLGSGGGIAEEEPPQAALLLDAAE